MTTTRISNEYVGTWIDSWWGQYAPDRIICIADEYGFEGNGDDHKWIEMAYERVDSVGAGMLDETGKDWETYFAFVQVELADEALHYMNTNYAEEGLHFDWFDGSLMYMPLCNDDEGCEDEECWHTFWF